MKPPSPPPPPPPQAPIRADNVNMAIVERIILFMISPTPRSHPRIRLLFNKYSCFCGESLEMAKWFNLRRLKMNLWAVPGDL